MTTRRKFNREFKLEAVRLVKEQDISVAEAARGLDLRENVLRKWVQAYEDDPTHALPGSGQLKPEQAEVLALKKEIRKLKAERDILKKAASSSVPAGVPDILSSIFHYFLHYLRYISATNTRIIQTSFNKFLVTVPPQAYRVSCVRRWVFEASPDRLRRPSLGRSHWRNHFSPS